jgi:hypothetical protein
MIRKLSGLGALVCYTVCLSVPVLFFIGRMGEAGYKLAFGLASAGWFVGATVWMARRARKTAP